MLARGIVGDGNRFLEGTGRLRLELVAERRFAGGAVVVRFAVRA